MKRMMIAVASLIFLCAGMAFPVAGRAEENSINVTGAAAIGPDSSASAFFGEYERAVGRKVSLLGRLGSVDYSYDDGTYAEDGDAKGFDIGVRIYPRGGMRGFFFGGSVGLWSSDWTFTDDKGTFYETQGKGSSDAVRLDLEVGGRFPLGDGPVSLMPAFHLGNFFSTGSDCTYTKGAVGSCDLDSDFGIYAVVALSLGVSF